MNTFITVFGLGLAMQNTAALHYIWHYSSTSESFLYFFKWFYLYFCISLLLESHLHLLIANKMFQGLKGIYLGGQQKPAYTFLINFSFALV